jgi:DNA polymerase III delta prime subunit
LIINEFSYFTPNAQSALLDVIESSSASTRFFLTGNYIEKFLPAIVSRCQPYLIQSPEPKQIFENFSNILGIENVTFDPHDLVKVIRTYYPDQRQMLNYLQSNSNNGKFVFNEQLAQTNDFCSKTIDILKSNATGLDKYTNIRQLFADAKVRQFDDLFTALYANLDAYVPEGKKSAVIGAIANGQHRSVMVIDKEIQAINCVCEIINLIK